MQPENNPIKSPEKELWCAVIRQAATDALGFFNGAESFEDQYAAIEEKIRYPKKSIKKRKYPPKTWREKANHHEIVSSRAWFKGASKDFRTVCDMAGLDWQNVKERMVKKITVIESWEQKVFELEDQLKKQKQGDA